APGGGTRREQRCCELRRKLPLLCESRQIPVGAFPITCRCAPTAPRPRAPFGAALRRRKAAVCYVARGVGTADKLALEPCRKTGARADEVAALFAVRQASFGLIGA